MVFSLDLVLPLLLFGCVDGINADTHLQKLNSHADFANHILSFLSDNNSKLSLSCSSELYYYGTGLLSGQWWATRMFYAGAKLPPEILDTKTPDLGSFDECLNISVKLPSTEEVLGKYCLGTPQSSRIFPETPSNRDNPFINRSLELESDTKVSTLNGNPQFGICLPSSCSSAELEQLYFNILKFSDKLCQTKASYEVKLNARSISAISFFGIILWVMLLSTVYDTILHYMNKKCEYPILIAFSVLTNGRKILATYDNEGHISCLHGIRVITTMWLILHHEYFIQETFPLKKYGDIVPLLENPANIIIGGSIAVDTFFFMGGLVNSYTYLSAMAKGTKFNIIMYYIHRYLRLTPVLAVIIIIHVALLQHMGSGPIWPHTIQRELIDGCEKYWWKTVLYIQNFGDQTSLCILQGWYLNVDFQLFLLSPLLLVPLSRWPNLALSATGFLAACSIATCFLTAWFFELNSHVMGNTGEKLKNYYRYYYAATQTRAAPWLIGIIVGYFIFQLKHKRVELKINKGIVIAIWVTSLAVLSMCLFLGGDLISGTYDRLANSFHMALVRPAWAVALAGIIFVCASGYGGPINWFLSAPVFQVLSKLTYTMYLVHFTVIYITTLQMRDAYMFSIAKMFYGFWGDFMFTIVVGLVFTLAFELPIITIEKVLFERTKRKVKVLPLKEDYERKSEEIP